jgi:hypothetical protein
MAETSVLSDLEIQMGVHIHDWTSPWFGSGFSVLAYAGNIPEF